MRTRHSVEWVVIYIITYDYDFFNMLQFKMALLSIRFSSVQNVFNG